MKCDYNKCGCHTVTGTPIAASTVPKELQPFIKQWPRDTWMQKRLAKVLKERANELSKVQS